MEIISGQTFDGGVEVETDGKTFTDCTFQTAIIVYRGGEHPLFERCRFTPEVTWHFRGPALRTIQFLQRIANDDGGEHFIADLFAKGKYFADEEATAG